MQPLVPMTDGVTILVALAEENKTSLKHLRPSDLARVSCAKIPFSVGCCSNPTPIYPS